MEDINTLFCFNGKSIINHERTDQKVYHYTSPTGLYSTIKNQNIWFTDCQFMNDKSEYVYIKNVLIKALKLYGKEFEDLECYADYLIGRPYESIYLDTSKPSLNFKKSRYYLFCASLNPDSHNMWCYFTKNGNYEGYNLRFDIDSFVNLFSSIPDLTLVHGKVIYDEQEQIRQLRDKIEILNDQYNQNLEAIKGQKLKDEFGNEYNKEDFIDEEYQSDLSDFLQERCLFFKNSAFESENEYRIVIKTPSEFSHEHFRLGHRVGNNGIIIPFREFHFDTKKVIDQITLGPMLETDVAKAGLVSLLNLSYEQQFDIKCSDIDVRF